MIVIKNRKLGYHRVGEEEVGKALPHRLPSVPRFSLRSAGRKPTPVPLQAKVGG